MRVKVGVLEEITTENIIPATEDKIDDLLGLKLVPVKELSSEKVEQLKVESGVFVEEVKDGPAKDAGIQVGDVITTMAFKEVSNLEDYNSILSELSIEDNLAVRIVRNGNGSFITIKLKK